MKKIRSFLSILFCCLLFVSCSNCNNSKPIELMGAGDRIHDTYTFANVGVKIKNDSEDVFTIYGSVEKLTDENVKNEFNIASDIDYVVAIKLSAVCENVVSDEVSIRINGTRNYDAEHLNGSNYTFIILEVILGEVVSIKVKWNNNSEKNYIINFDENLLLN